MLGGGGGWGWGGARGKVVFRKATIPLGERWKQAVKSEPGRGKCEHAVYKANSVQEHTLFSELEKCATTLLTILCKYQTDTEDNVFRMETA